MKLQPYFPLQTDPLPISQPNVSGSGAGTSGPQPNLGLFCVVTISQELYFFLSFFFFLMLIFNSKPPTLKFSKKNLSLTPLATISHWLELYILLPSPLHHQHPTSEVRIFLNGSFEATYQSDSLH